MRRKNEENYLVNFSDYVTYDGDGKSGKLNGFTPKQHCFREQ